MPSREICQFAKNLVAVLPVKVWRLKAKGIEISVLGPTLPRFIFGKKAKKNTEAPEE